LISANQALSCCSVSGCLFQVCIKVFLDIILKIAIGQSYNIYQNGKMN
jgi:hypothetical protein